MNNITTTIDWPPSFTLKKSPRARHVRIKASVRHGLELVVPMRFNQKNIPEILETNKSWILNQMEQIKVRLDNAVSQALPSEIFFSATQSVWKIDYIKSDNLKLRLFKRPPAGLALLGDTEDKAAIRKILTTWIRNQAKVLLAKRLEELSVLTGLPYSSVSIRGQRSRWGSCSSDKAINLNYKLLFLPPQLMDHIIIHELCHTVHLDHSAKFWRLVSSFDPNWKEHSREIKKADHYVPAWLEL